MTGLDKILNQINEDSQNSVKGILDTAKSEADEIISNAKAEASKKASEILEKAKKTADIVIERANSSADIEVKRNVLYKKQEIISGIIEEAKKKLKELPDDEYFDVIQKLIEKYQTEEEGEIVFSEKDKARLPGVFTLKKLTLSEKTGNFDGGFVLVYGDIEMNCTFDALFDGAYEELSDTVNQIVF